MEQPAFEPIRVDLTRAEYARGIAQIRSLARRRRANRPFVAKLINAVTVSVIPVLFVVGANAFTPISPPAVWAFVLVLAAYAGFAVWVSRSGIVYRSGPLDDGAILRQHIYTILKDGLQIESELTCGRVNWRAIKRVEDDAGLILIFVDRSNAYIMPHRVFPDRAAVERFVAHLKSQTTEPEPAVA